LSPFLQSVALGYLLGSLPLTYLLIKRSRNIDLRGAGSGNVGALNAMETTGSKGLGITVLLIDALKGAGAVALSAWLHGPSAGFPVVAAAGAGAVAGQIFSPWLSFRGGRGLATSFGAALSVAWMLAAYWIGAWIVTFLVIRRDIHVANIAATGSMAMLAALIPSAVIMTAGAQTGASESSIIIFAVVLAALILLGHRGIIHSWLKPHDTDK
jgi:glycerol-3-phosphate acyltransferase PlsY